MSQLNYTIQNIINDKKEKFYHLCHRHYVKALYVFGSAVTDSFNEESDIDFLYSFDLENFADWARADYDYADNLLCFEKELSQFFNRKVNLVPDEIITNKYLKQNIEKTKYKVYAA